jgi:hypothetical protein
MQVVKLIIVAVLVIVSCSADAAKIRKPDAPEIRISSVMCR